jgi:serine/threonine-protein kinase
MLLATLTHPNTVQVFDYGHTADGVFYYVMEYLPGLDLARLVGNHGPLPPGRAVHLLAQVCRALREAHAAGLIHRDLKPGNIMVCTRGGVPDVAKLLDFGLVQVESGSGLEDPANPITRHGAVLGTPAYMSPEQAGGLPAVRASDVYSLGATAYFLLTARPVFERPTWQLTLAAHLRDAPPPPGPDVPADLAAVLARCLAKTPEDRFTDVVQLETALAGCSCAGEWTEEQAARWWAENRPGSGADPRLFLATTATR